MSRPKQIDVSSQEVKWQWYDSYDWKVFDNKSTDTLEKAYLSNPNGEITLSVNNTQYKITFSNMTQTNLNTSYTVRLIRPLSLIFKRET
jgi:hypothetical protein